MASRLYRTTRPLFTHVVAALKVLGVGVVVGGNSTAFGLVALSMSGLVLLDARQTQPRISAMLPARCHDALNRLLRTMPLSTRALPAGLIRFAQVLSRWLGTPGYLCVDDVVIEKPFARRLAWAAWTYSHSKKQKVYGVHIVSLSWSSDPAGTWRIPVAVRVWRPRRSCTPGHYQKKTDLVVRLLREVVAAGCPAAYVAGDTDYTGGQVSKTVARLGLACVGTIAPRTTVVYRGRRQQVRSLAATLQPKWRPTLGVRALALLVDAPSLGPVRLVVLGNERGHFEYQVISALTCDLALLVHRKSGRRAACSDSAALTCDLALPVHRKRSRWRIETIFRETKQLAGLGACQCWVDQAFVRPVVLVFLTFVVLQILRHAPQDTAGAVKARRQGEVLRDGQTPPQPLRAMPPEFRLK